MSQRGERTREAEEMLRQGKSIAEVLEKTKLSNTHIYAIRKQLGLRPKDAKADAIAKAKVLLGKGVSVSDVAEQTGLSTGYLYKVRQRLAKAQKKHRQSPVKAYKAPAPSVTPAAKDPLIPLLRRLQPVMQAAGIRRLVVTADGEMEMTL